MPPAARIGDMHTCPLVNGLVPHVGGPILPPCCPTVLIGGIPAARMGDQLTCVGPPDVIAIGSPTVLIGNQMAARLGDMTVHGGVIVIGEPTVIIGEVGAGSPIPPDSGMGRVSSAMSAAARTQQSSGNTDADSGGPPSNTPQAATLVEAANEGTPLVEKCPYADH
ncbi:MAG TPA: PAAR domain-containing protein [Bryobacteraceae bacterium]|nr:PAAR domain-containing protein [Bryobacteraceae bacterium]